MHLSDSTQVVHRVSCEYQFSLFSLTDGTTVFYSHEPEMSVVNIHYVQTCNLVSRIIGCSAALITPLSFQNGKQELQAEQHLFYQRTQLVKHQLVDCTKHLNLGLFWK